MSAGFILNILIPLLQLNLCLKSVDKKTVSVTLCLSVVIYFNEQIANK